MQSRVTVVIPLYKSAPFLDTIITNVEALPEEGTEVLISDRHCYDDTIDILARRYAHDHRVRCIKHRDELDWVGHINALLLEAKGEFWRFLPHDDFSPPGSLEALIEALETNDDAILAYGPTLAIDKKGSRLPDRDRTCPHPVEAEHGWTLGLVLQMFWKGFFDGAFKGLIRRDPVLSNQLLIRSTRDQIFPERCWLFALCLLGRFHFVPDATYIKRFYSGSVHSHWQISGHHYLSASQVMGKYLHKLLGQGPVSRCGMLDLISNGWRISQWLANPVGECQAYRPAPCTQKDLIRKMELPATAGSALEN